jgi:hypothetical protein
MYPATANAMRRSVRRNVARFAGWRKVIVSTLGTIENDLVAALAGLRVGSVPLFAAARGGSPSADRKRVAAEILRERMPAAYVVVSGREASDRTSGRVGGAEVTVLLADRSERSDAEARTGGVGVVGGFALAGEVAKCLRGLAVGGDRRLVLVSERGLAVDAGVVLWEQSYAVRGRVLGAPTLDGQVVTGVASEVAVDVGPVRRAVSAVAFPGVEGTVRRDLGGRGRAIGWTGELRAADDAEMNALEAGLEAEAAGGIERRMVDGFGSAYDGCVMQAYERKGPRGRDEVSGEVVQRFEIAFEQL